MAGNFSEDTRKKGKGAKTGAYHVCWRFYLSQYDWLKGSHMIKVVWLPTETNYSYCEFVANTPYCQSNTETLFLTVFSPECRPRCLHVIICKEGSVKTV